MKTQETRGQKKLNEISRERQNDGSENITRKVATEPIHKMENKKAQKWTKDGGNQMVESLLTFFKRMKEKRRGVFRTHSNIYDGASLRKQKKKISPLMRKERKQILLKEECFLTDLFSKTHEGKEEI